MTTNPEFTYEDKWFAVRDINEHEPCAFFRYLDKPNETPPTGRHVAMFVMSDVLNKIDAEGSTKEDSNYLLGIYQYVMDTSLAFAAQNGRERCIIFSLGKMSNKVYSTLAKTLANKPEYEVKIYVFGRWIEIYKVAAGKAAGKKK